MHELEVLLSRLKMEHLSYHVESLLEQAAKKRAELPGVPVHGATAGMERQASARYGVPAEAGSSAVGQNAGAVRLYLPAGHRP